MPETCGQTKPAPRNLATPLNPGWFCLHVSESNCQLTRGLVQAKLCRESKPSVLEPQGLSSPESDTFLPSLSELCQIRGWSFQSVALKPSALLSFWSTGPW